jgi:small-conductance mechanosensitive channel
MKLIFACALISLAICLSAASGQAAMTSTNSEITVKTEPVRIDGVILFWVRGISANPASERAAAIVKRIKTLADNPSVTVESIVTVESDNSTDLMSGDRLIMSVFDADAELEGVNRRTLAKVYETKIRTAIDTYRQNRSRRSLLQGAGSALGATVLLIALILLIRRGSPRIIEFAEKRFTERLRTLQDKSHDIVKMEAIWRIIVGGLRTGRVLIVLVIFLFYIEVILRLFPWTRTYAVPFFELITNPLQKIGISVLNYIPSFIFLVILIFIARFILKLLRMFFLGVEQGKIKLLRFETAWAIPTYKIIRLGVIALTVVVAYPYIPGSESQAFKGVSIFLGIVFSLGSSSSISNIIAGYMVIFRRAFRTGDRVKIGNHIGDVIEIRLQATHLRTIKNEEIVVPNSLILNTEVLNYSSMSRQGGLILHTSVTIGYDAPWRQIHALLLLAAERTTGLLREPRPFVLQTALNDFYVSYELNAYTDYPRDMTTVYSEMHQKIQDTFNEFGVQIMSPHYLGDPKEAKIVPKEKWHQPPAKPDEGDGSR